MFKHILIATDGSELAGKGLERGLALAKAVGAKVTIATVTEPWSSFEMAYQVRSGNPDPTGQYDKQVAKLAMSVLKEAGQKAEALGVPVATLHIKDMPPAEGIVEAASKNGCDLIVMSSHGRRGVRRFVLGSQTAEVVTHTDIPVLVIR